MPELPEVETMVRGIRQHVEGRIIQRVQKCRCSCKPILLEPTIRSIQRRAQGQAVRRVFRIAKRVVIELQSDDSFVIEPRMTGLMLLSDPPDPGHLRLQWDFADADSEYPSLWFWDRRGLGTIRLYTQEERDTFLGGDYLGPDALEITQIELTERLKKTRREIKVALLDQKLVAGIGNLYASEILHLARVSPTAVSAELKPKQIAKITDSIGAILNKAITYEGSTLGDGTYRNALNQDGSYQNAHRVYAQEDEVCPTCEKATIVRIVQTQRSTFFCPKCQK